MAGGSPDRPGLAFGIRLFGLLARPIHPDFTASSSSLHAAGACCTPMSKPSWKSPTRNLILGINLILFGLALGAAGITLGESDDAPGAAVLGFLLAIGLLTLGVKIACRKT